VYTLVSNGQRDNTFQGGLFFLLVVIFPLFFSLVCGEGFSSLIT